MTTPLTIDTVLWESRAQGKIPQEETRQRLSAELVAVFASDGIERVTVHDVFIGFKNEPLTKVILGVETFRGGVFQSHIIKLGDESEVGRDFDGWQECVAQRHVRSRLFVPVTKRSLPDRTSERPGLPPIPRWAVLYENAYLFFGFDSEHQVPVTWQSAAEKGIKTDDPNSHDFADMASVERVVVDLFGDLHEWFYKSAKHDPQRAVEFYTSKFQKVADRWRADPALPNSDPRCDRAVLRADALWLLSGRDAPQSPEAPKYLDPVDYIAWALQHAARDVAARDIPFVLSTLVGPTHGDLHGQNILVGVSRHEARSPILYDYGEMARDNVVAWDFVKLEMELKSRLLPWILDNDHETHAAFLARSRRARRVESPDRPQAELKRSQRAQRLAWLSEIERLLAQESHQIDSVDQAESREPPSRRDLIPGQAALSRLLTLLLRIRQEAALVLGSRHPGAFGGWRDEYNFALAVYGLTTAKWNSYQAAETESALVSAGVACAELTAAKMSHEPSAIAANPTSAMAASYRIPLYLAHQAWGRNDHASALAILAAAEQQFSRCVPLKAETALNLAATGDVKRALEAVAPFRSLCPDFGDHETLTRIGRCLKERAGRNWQEWIANKTTPDHEVLRQLYEAAYKAYREAYEIHQHYFPGINAATMALLSRQDTAVVEQLIQSVKQHCQKADTSHADCYWVFATEAEVALIRGDFGLAASRYLAAFTELTPQTIQHAQSSWRQVCRVGYFLGQGLAPIVDVFLSVAIVRQNLDIGPFNFCSERFPNRALLNEVNRAGTWFQAQKTHPVWAKRLSAAQSVSTLEGLLEANAGDYLCRGPAGELWPQSVKNLESKYEPTGLIEADGWQQFTPRPDGASVKAAQINHDFTVHATWGELRGKSGDYLVKNAADQDVPYPDNVWIVARSIFQATYETTNR